MLAKRHRYTLARLAWGALTVGGTAAVVSGRTEPLLSVSRLPVGDGGVGAVGFGAALTGWAAIGLLRRRAWRGAGSRAGLSPESGRLGPVGFPDLTGTVRGRSVRVRVVNEGDGNSSSRRTLVEAPLSGPTDRGLVVGRTTGGDPAQAAPSFGSVDPETTAVDDEFWAVGDEALARAVLTPEVRATLRAAGEVDGVYVGDVSGLLQSAAPDVGGSIGDKLTALTTSQLTPGDGTTVVWKLRPVVLDPATLEERADAVAAVADAFEAATPGGPSATTGERARSDDRGR